MNKNRLDGDRQSGGRIVRSESKDGVAQQNHHLIARAGKTARNVRPIAVPLVVGVVVALVCVLGTWAPSVSASSASGDPTWTSFTSPYIFLNDQYPGCGNYTATAANVTYATPSGVVDGTGFSLGEHLGGGGSCNQTGGQYAFAGTHTPTGFQPPTSGLYWVNASFTFTVVLTVWAQCGSATYSGVNLESYSGLNITAIVALYDDTQSTGWGVESTQDQFFHLDSRAAYCVASSKYGDPNAALTTLTLRQTFKLECKGYLLATDEYVPRAGVDFSGFASAPASGSEAGYAIAPQSAHTQQMAVINSITVAP